MARLRRKALPNTLAVLFDLDGTLIDPFIGIAGAYREVCASLGVVELTDAEVRQLIGPPVQDAISKQFRIVGDDLDRAVWSYREYYSSSGVHEFTPFVGIEELLVDLKRLSFQVDIATSKPAIYAKEIVELAGWQDLVTHVGGAELDGSRRHKADVIAWVLAQLQDGEQAVMFVGDRPEDVAGARTNNLPCIAVDWGFSTTSALLAAGAHSVVHSVAELKDQLRGLMSR